MNTLLDLPPCPPYLIDPWLRIAGVSGEMLEQHGQSGIAVVIANGRRGIASHLDDAEAAAPDVQWADSRGELVRHYQRAMRRLGWTRSFALSTLMGRSMQ